jgi:hypothetical protein
MRPSLNPGWASNLDHVRYRWLTIFGRLPANGDLSAIRPLFSTVRATYRRYGGGAISVVLLPRSKDARTSGARRHDCISSPVRHAFRRSRKDGISAVLCAEVERHARLAVALPVSLRTPALERP